MAHDKTTWLLTIKSNDGHPLFALLVESEPLGEPTAPPPSPAAPDKPLAPGPDGEPKITEPQRRYLFRLLALQGVEGKAAEDHLKTYFKVKSLRDIPKAGASQLIDQMAKDQKEVRDGAA
jgi:hypothetical protein